MPVRTWWNEIAPDAVLQAARRTARLPVVVGHVALMPDAHVRDRRDHWLSHSYGECHHSGGRGC